MSMEQKEFSSMPPRPKPGASISEAAPWYSIAPGIWEYLLNKSTSGSSSHQGEKSVIQWFEPNVRSPTDDVITHDYIEEVVFIEGGLRDLTLAQEWGPRAYAFRLPGMRHGTYKARRPAAPSERSYLEFVRCVSVVKEESF